MAGPISRRPAGLLDLLLTQQQGRNPAELADGVQPVMELAPFYGQERLTVTQGALSASAVGQGATITIPQGESWQIVTVSARATFNAASQILRLALFAGVGGSAFTTLGENSSTAVGATDRFSVSSGCMSPLILPAGSQVGALVHEVDLAAGAAISVTSAVLFVRMEN